MALLTALPDAAARTLLSSYGCELLELKALAAGSVNSNFFLRVRRDEREESLFARIYEEQGVPGAIFELRLNEQLHAAGLPVARPVRRSDGELYCEFEGKPFAVYERLAGEVYCQKMVTPQAAYAIGAALAGVHVAVLGDLEVGPSRFGFSAIEERLRRVEEAGRTELQPAVDEIRSLSSRIQKERCETLPTGLIHGDLFRDNALITGGEVSGLLDFESASKGPFVYDLMVTLLAWCFGDTLSKELSRRMVEGYLSVRQLTSSERENMVLEGSVACIRFASTRLTDFSLRVSAGEKPLRDYGRFLERLRALEAGVLDEALDGLF